MGFVNDHIHKSPSRQLLVEATAIGLVGGAVNAAAGGAKLFVFPMLLATGLPPIAANVTQGVALWPAQLPAVWVYRRELAAEARRLARRMIPALVGALLGAVIMVNASDDAFIRVVPFLLAISVVAIVLGPRTTDLMHRAFPGKRLETATGVLLALIGFYGGFFGAGMGFMLLAVLSASAGAGLGQVNGAKNLFAVAIQSVAVVPMMFVLPYFNRYFFRVTGRIYLGPMVTCLIFIMVLISNTVFYLPL